MTELPNLFNRWLVFALLFPLVFLNGWLVLKVLQYFQPIFTILVLAALLAFVLNYPVQFLQSRRLPRSVAVLFVFLGSLVVLTALGITLIPILGEQLSEIASVLPNWIQSGSQQLQVLHDWGVSHNLPVSFSHLIGQLSSRLPEELQTLSQQVFHLIVSTIDDISDAILTAVLTFYLLLDGERLWDGVFVRLPAKFGLPVKRSLQENFHNYFVGQVALALLVGSTMTLIFLLLQVPYGFLFGLGIGFIALIPFGDVIGLGLVSLLVISQDLWLGIKVVGAGVLLDQVIDQIIAPRILGRFTGLRPVWIIVSLLVGAKIGGLLGLLIAVPLASFIKDAVEGFPGYAISGDVTTPTTTLLQRGISESEMVVTEGATNSVTSQNPSTTSMQN